MLVSPNIELQTELAGELPPVEAHPANQEVDTLNLLPPSKRDLSDKKRKGVFYTPDEAAQLLAKWGIRSADDTVLEPSFGGCGFLEAVLSQLKELGAENPQRQLFGCDIDPAAFEHLNRLLDAEPSTTNFKARDFLQVLPADFQLEGVDTVIGNPPYVSWHNMLPSQRESAAKVTLPSGLTLNQKGSLWSFFVIHSLQYLKPGGRMAWILPGSFLYAEYAAPLRDIIAGQFSRSLAVVLEQRIFVSVGTEESSVILLCEGYRQVQEQACLQPMRLVLASTLPDLKAIIEGWTLRVPTGVVWDQPVNRLLAPEAAMATYDRLCNNEPFRRLGSLVKIRIGLVTGNNKFFVLKRSVAKMLKLPTKAFRVIVARQAHFRGLQVTPVDIERLEQQDARCLLLNTNVYRGKRKPKSLTDYLNSYSQDDIKDNRTFAKREPWHQIGQETTPDGFFSCMNWYGPILVLNTAQTTCTNTIYRVDFEVDLFTAPDIQHHVAVCLQSTFSQFSAEISGRYCGSGALKLEPSEAGRIGMLLPTTTVDATEVFAEIDAHLRAGKHTEARQTADLFLIQQGILTRDDIHNLERGLDTLRRIRRGARHSSSNESLTAEATTS